MAQVELVFRNNAGTVVVMSAWKTAGQNLSRMLAAEQINLGAADQQETSDKLLDRIMSELIGDTRTVEKNAVAFTPITKEP